MPIPALVGAAIAAGVSAIASSITSAASKKRQQQRQNAYNRQAMELENQLNKQAWDEQNEYNLPANQMQRFKDAGLNPNLVYSQGTAGNAESAPSYGVPEQSFANFLPEALDGVASGVLNTINQYQAVQMSQSQIQAQNIANEKALAELPYASQLAYLRAHGAELSTLQQEFDLSTNAEKMRGIQLKNELTEKQSAQMDKKLQEFDYRFRQMDDQHRLALINQALSEVNLATKEDEYRYGLELTRIQGRLLQAESLSDINYKDVIKLVLYYLSQHLNIRLPHKNGKFRQTTKENYDADGVLKGGTVTTIVNK